MSNRQHPPSARALCAHGRLLLQFFAAGHMAPRRGLASFNARHNILQVATRNTPQKCCFHRPSQSRCDLLRTSWEDTSLLTIKTPWSGRVPHEAVNIPEEYNNGDGHRLLCHCRHPCLFVVCRRVRVINDSVLRNAHLATRQVTSSVCCGKKGNWPSVHMVFTS